MANYKYLPILPLLVLVTRVPPFIRRQATCPLTQSVTAKSQEHAFAQMVTHSETNHAKCCLISMPCLLKFPTLLPTTINELWKLCKSRLTSRNVQVCVDYIGSEVCINIHCQIWNGASKNLFDTNTGCPENKDFVPKKLMFQIWVKNWLELWEKKKMSVAAKSSSKSDSPSLWAESAQEYILYSTFYCDIYLTTPCMQRNICRY